MPKLGSILLLVAVFVGGYLLVNSSSGETPEFIEEIAEDFTDQETEEITSQFPVGQAGDPGVLVMQQDEEEINNEDNTEESMQNEMMTMKTNMGEIKIELYHETRPITAGNFAKLAKEGFYDGVKFHRVIPNFMNQAGDPQSKDDTLEALWGTGGPGYTIEDEFEGGNINARGTLSMANAGPNTGGSQFFMNVVDNNFLDAKHSVFGMVIEGMDVVDAINATPTLPGDRPVDPVVIESISF